MDEYTKDTLKNLGFFFIIISIVFMLIVFPSIIYSHLKDIKLFIGLNLVLIFDLFIISAILHDVSYNLFYDNWLVSKIEITGFDVLLWFLIGIMFLDLLYVYFVLY